MWKTMMKFKLLTWVNTNIIDASLCTRQIYVAGTAEKLVFSFRNILCARFNKWKPISPLFTIACLIFPLLAFWTLALLSLAVAGFRNISLAFITTIAFWTRGLERIPSLQSCRSYTTIASLHKVTQTSIRSIREKYYIVHIKCLLLSTARTYF